MTSITSARARRLPSHRLRTLAGIALFLLPAFALYVLFVIYPIAQAARFSLYDWNGLEPLTDFVGLANFERALADPRLSDAADTTLWPVRMCFRMPFSSAASLM